MVVLVLKSLVTLKKVTPKNQRTSLLKILRNQRTRLLIVHLVILRNLKTHHLTRVLTMMTHRQMLRFLLKKLLKKMTLRARCFIAFITAR